MLHTTPTYGITWADDDTPVKDIAAVTQAAAETIDAALIRGGIAPPAAQDLAALAGRVTAVEKPTGRQVTKTVAQTASGSSWHLLTWEDLPASTAGPGMWSASAPSRMVVTKAGRYRLAVNGVHNVFGLMARKNGAGSAGAGTMVATHVSSSTAGMVPPLNADEIPLAVGDYIEIFGIPTAAGTIATASYTGYFSLTWFGNL